MPSDSNNFNQFTNRIKSDEFYNFFFHRSKYGIWFALLDKPMPVNLPIDQQEEHMFKYAYLAECNFTFAKMYGYEHVKELIGARFPQLFIRTDTTNMDNLRVFLKNDYRIENIECHETGKNGERKYSLNDIVGVIKDDHLVRVWGRQKDITAEKSKREVLKQLTPEQIKILKITVEGKTMKEIASEVGISLKSVESLRNQIKAIIGVDTVAQLIATAIQLGIQNVEV
jgi:DNA-binding CsgD family transcriptional regulator